MSEQECILLSIILNMAMEGKTDLNSLHPALAKFIEGTVEEYYEDEEDGNLLYNFAMEELEPAHKRMYH